jgi:hypothetical protein
VISNTTFKTYTNPWKHVQSESGFFLPEVYENLTNILYSDAVKDWDVYNDDGSDPAYPQGQVVMINEEAREKSTGFLREFYDWLWTGELDAKIYEVTGVQFKRYSWLWHLDYPGFEQGWHNDIDAYPDTEVTTFQVYMAQDDSKASSGVLVSDTKEKTQAQVPYIPNHAWGFTASANTWHSVPDIDFYRPSFMIRNFKNS